MHRPMSDLLNAYLDNELDDYLCQEVEHHLEGCGACREKHEQLRRLSVLLRTVPSPVPTWPDHFAATLTQKLPSRSRFPYYHRLSSVVWIAPWALLATWLIVRLVFLFSGLFGLAREAGLIQSAALLSFGNETNLWIALLKLLLGHSSAAQTQTLLSILHDLSIWYEHLWKGFLVQAGVALAYWLWIWFLRLTGDRFSVHIPASV